MMDEERMVITVFREGVEDCIDPNGCIRNEHFHDAGRIFLDIVEEELRAAFPGAEIRRGHGNGLRLIEVYDSYGEQDEETVWGRIEDRVAERFCAELPLSWWRE